MKVNSVWQNIRDILCKMESDSDEELQPTSHAQAICELALKNVSILKSKLPNARVVITDDGGLRITWAGLDREIRLICADEPIYKSYIYKQDISGLFMIVEIEDGILEKELNWLNKK